MSGPQTSDEGLGIYVVVEPRQGTLRHTLANHSGCYMISMVLLTGVEGFSHTRA